MHIFRQIQYSQNWNIGFCTLTEEEFIINKKIGHIHWLKHSYKDRWFADPFIYSITDRDIVVFVEELLIDRPIGYLVELIIDRNTYEIRERHILLKLPTHLSYPAYIWYKGKCYVYPESGASGKLNIYEYDPQKHTLVNPVTILNEALADATIFKHGENDFYLIATKVPDVQEKAFLYKSSSPIEPFVPVSDAPIVLSRECSRSAGNCFNTAQTLYRPSQNCANSYGGAIAIMQVDSIWPYNEHLLFRINPFSYRYNLGIHTINFYHSHMNESIVAIDGCGYLRPILGRIYNSKFVRYCVIQIKRAIKC